jgi:peptidyl-prolyl cis-trans isomerase D
MTEGFEPRRLFSYLIILAIAVVFVLQFGPSSRGCDVRQNPHLNAATVNGRDIPMDELSRAYGQQLYSFKARLGGQQEISDDILRQLVKPEQVLDQLVNGELLAQAAEREGVVASDAEVRELLHQSPDFQRDGKFDYGRYTDVLRQYYRKTPATYETDLRRRISARKLLELVQASAVVSEDEVKARFRRESDRAQLTFVRFLPALYAKDVKAPTPKEISDYAAAHADAVAQEYQSNKAAYRKPEEVRVRHIELKVLPGASDTEKNKLRERLLVMKKEIEGGKDFAEVARGQSEDTVTKESGGDLGFKTREGSGWLAPFARVAFSLEPGKISDPVETPYGMHLMRVEEKRPAQDQPLDAVKLRIAEQLLRKERAKQLAKAAAEDALKKAKTGKKLTELYPASTSSPNLSFATESKPEAVDTGSFSLAEGNIPKLGAAPGLLDKLRHQTTTGLFPELQPVGDGGFAVIDVTERKHADDTEYQAQREQLYDEALQGKRMELQDAYLKAVKKSAQIVRHEAAIQTLTGSG